MTETARLRSYGRRKARPLSERKDRLLNELLPTLCLPLREPAPSPLASLFAQPVGEVWLEIGFGSGEHLVWQAEHHPEIGFIGCEPFINGVASLLGKIETLGLNTIRIHASDAAEDGCRKLDGRFRAVARGETPAPIRLFSADELGLASGKTNVIHAALIQGGAAAKFLASASRAERYRKGNAAAFAQPSGSDADKE